MQAIFCLVVRITAIKHLQTNGTVPAARFVCHQLLHT